MFHHGSKNTPFASQFDDPGKPYDTLVDATGCPTGPESFLCLQNVPFEVIRFIVVGLILTRHIPSERN
jgi:hypothetical protein